LPYAVIQDSNTIYEHSIKKFEGTNDGDVSYAIIFEGMDDSKIKFEKFEDAVVALFNKDKTILDGV
jgi:hypothetical protein